MGVINLTPNSFSDGKENLTSVQVFDQLNHLEQAGCRYFDFGAESTAPMNDSINFETEVKRLDQLLSPLIEKGVFNNKNISIDTYRPQTFKYLYQLIEKHTDVKQLIWNDVSGILDDELLDILINHCPNTKYVYSHSHVPSRDLTGYHMDYLHHEADIFFEVKEYFEQALEVFKWNHIGERVIFDPCFGFSKTRAQNLTLIEKTPELIQSFSEDLTWLLGISRKSFLRPLNRPELSSDEALQFAEVKHREILHVWERDLESREVMIRLHDPMILKS